MPGKGKVETKGSLSNQGRIIKDQTGSVHQPDSHTQQSGGGKQQGSGQKSSGSKRK